MYEVFTERKAERDLKKLPGEVFHRIVPHLNSLSENPNPSGCRKIVGSKTDWRIRVGDYRIIYEVNAFDKTVKVMRVRHRKEAYK